MKKSSYQAYNEILQSQQRECLGCGKFFLPQRRDQVRCVKGCRRIRVRERWSNRTPEERTEDRARAFGVGRRGAACELRVAVELLERGWEVLQPFSPVCPFDLLAWKDGRGVRIQVRMAVENRGQIVFKAATEGTCDVTAAVLPDRIIYLPAEPLE
jgi:hypothetical protein